jgi:hypothetical protein
MLFNAKFSKVVLPFHGAEKSFQDFMPGRLREAVLPPSTGRAWPVI